MNRLRWPMGAELFKQIDTLLAQRDGPLSRTVLLLQFS